MIYVSYLGLFSGRKRQMASSFMPGILAIILDTIACLFVFSFLR